MPPPFSSSSSPSTQPTPTPSPTCLKRLHTELRSLQNPSTPPSPALLLLTPIDPETNILHWRALLRGPAQTAYAHGLWELEIHVPPTYPLLPPQIHFVTPVCHPNVSFPRGEICLDLLKNPSSTTSAPTSGSSSNSGGRDAAGGGAGGAGGWSPAYTLVTTLEAIHMLLAYPVCDSPLNVDAAVLFKGVEQGGDKVAGESLVRYWCEEFRYRGPEV